MEWPLRDQLIFHIKVFLFHHIIVQSLLKNVSLTLLKQVLQSTVIICCQCSTANGHEDIRGYGQ